MEFGEWLPDGERQAVLELGFDALHDLADALGLEPSAIGLAGTAAVAFGARGHGGKASAHYEPGRAVVNLTRLRGAGSAAHEWGHAFDHFLGAAGSPDPVEAGEPRYASGGSAHRKSRLDALALLPGRLPALADEVARALRLTPLGRAESAEAAEARARGFLERADAAAAKAAAHRAASARPDRKWLAAMSAHEASLRTHAAGFAASAAGIAAGTCPPGRRANSYLEQSRAVSGGGYWARPNEMLARALECAVFDGLAAAGRRSDYLVHGVEDGRFAGPEFSGDPYPAGAERARLSGMLLDLVREAAPMLAPDARPALAPCGM